MRTDSTADIPDQRAEWRTIVARYQQPDERRSWLQFLTSLGFYLIFWFLTYRALAISPWLMIPLVVLGAGFLVRLFIIFHDCGHGSFFRSRRLNDIVGTISGFLVFTPYYQWRHHHAVHHASSSDLDRRGIGDVWTLTVEEYLAASRRTQLAYRAYRHPLIMFFVGPLAIFMVAHRFAGRDSRPRERRSVHLTNLALLLVLAAVHFTIGLKAFVLVQLPILAVAGSAGVWLFYVQHQFEDSYWHHHQGWDYVSAALKGSSFYRLPKVLQWFTGSIGFHHIHHLSPRIPNYRLEACHYENPLFQQVEPVTVLGSLRSLNFRLYDERSRRMVGFGHLRELAAD